MRRVGIAVIALLFGTIVLSGCDRDGVFSKLQARCKDEGYNVIKGNGEWHCEDDAGNVITF